MTKNWEEWGERERERHFLLLLLGTEGRRQENMKEKEWKKEDATGHRSDDFLKKIQGTGLPGRIIVVERLTTTGVGWMWFSSILTGVGLGRSHF